jgi:hypothetical protein
MASICADPRTPPSAAKIRRADRHASSHRSAVLLASMGVLGRPVGIVSASSRAAAQYPTRLSILQDAVTLSSKLRSVDPRQRA